ncbi:MAG: hypothetical protein SGARI_005328 [Bacillariaceae sp.]
MRKLDVGGDSESSDGDAPSQPKSSKKLSKAKQSGKSSRKLKIDSESPSPSPKSQQKPKKDKGTKKQKSFKLSKSTKKEIKDRRKLSDRIEEAKSIQEDLDHMNQGTHDIIRAMQANMEARKREMLAQMRQEHGLDGIQEDDDTLQAEQDAAEFLEEQLRMENDELQSEISKMQMETPTLESEYASLLESNRTAQSMTAQLNEFVAKKTKQNQKLQESRKNLDDIYNGLVGLEYEPPMKEIVRKWMYSIAQRVSREDPSVFPAVQDAVNDCEFGMGVMPLDIASYDDVGSKIATAKLKSDGSTTPVAKYGHASFHDIAANPFDLERSIDELEIDTDEYTAALEEVSSKLDKKQFNMLIAIFKLLDKNKNGRIDLDEFRTGISTLNRKLPPASKLEGADRLFKALETDDKSGTIDLEEFQQLYR